MLEFWNRACAERFWFLPLDGKKKRLFEGFRNPAQEARCVSAIDQAVVIGER